MIGLIGIIVDLTERKAMEAQLRQAQKMEAIGHLAGGIAHDFRNQLTVIKGFSEMLLRRDRVTDEGRPQVEEVLKAVDRSTRLTGELLAFGRREMLQPKVEDLSKLISDLSKTLPRMIGEDIELNLIPSPKPCYANVDPGLFQQAMLNLMLNARDAMGGGGRLEIRSGVRTLEEPPADAPGFGPGRYVFVCVSDTGCGIEPEAIERIFEPFFTTKESGKGTGLGLSMVYGFARQSGGWVECESTLGEGTTFRLNFPPAEEPAEREAVERAEPAAGHAGARLLVVEDEASVRNLMDEWLTEAGHDVRAAANADEALALVRDGGLEPDLLITDVVMPTVNGVELAGKVRERRPQTPVLYVSGYVGEELARRGVETIREKMILKPVDREELLHRVGEVLRSGASQRTAQ